MARSSKPTSGVFWEVIAPLARWPLRSPARLATILGAIVAVLIVASTMSKQGESGTVSADPAPTSGVTSSPVGTEAGMVAPSTSTTSPNATPSAAKTVNQASASDTAVAFVRLWARPAVPQPTWSDDLYPLSTGAYGQQLTTVLPENVPAQHVTSAKPPAMNSAGATVIVGTDVGTVRVSLTHGPDGDWLVRSLAPENLTPTGSAGSTVAPHYTPLPTP